MPLNPMFIVGSAVAPHVALFCRPICPLAKLLPSINPALRSRLQRLLSDAMTSPASASSTQGVTVNGSRSNPLSDPSIHGLCIGRFADRKSQAVHAAPTPQHLDALGWRTPVSRKPATAALSEPSGTVQLLMYFMGISGVCIYRVTSRFLHTIPYA
jgi:hypothetical protein